MIFAVADYGRFACGAGYGGRPMSELVLLCYHGSAEARHAIATAGRLFGARAAIVLAVWEPAAEMTQLDPIGDAVGRLSHLYRDIDEIGREQAQAHAEEGAALAREHGFDARPRCAEGKAWRTIVAVADEEDVAAIVLGSRGLGTMERLIGGVSARVAVHARRPVLIIPPEPEQAAAAGPPAP
jgi:nucleotide-binding universal stress UspA family protein